MNVFFNFLLLSSIAQAGICSRPMTSDSELKSWIHEKMPNKSPLSSKLAPENLLVRPHLETPAQIFNSFPNSYVTNQLRKLNPYFLKNGIYPEVADLKKWAQEEYDKKGIPENERMYPGEIYLNSKTRERIAFSYGQEHSLHSEDFSNESHHIMGSISYIYALSKNVLPMAKTKGYATPTQVPRYHHEISHFFPLVLNEDYRKSILSLTKFLFKTVLTPRGEMFVHQLIYTTPFLIQGHTFKDRDNKWAHEKAKLRLFINEHIESAWGLKEEGKKFFKDQYKELISEEELHKKWKGDLKEILKSFDELTENLEKNYLALGGGLSDMLAIRQGIDGAPDLEQIFLNDGLAREVLKESSQNLNYSLSSNDYLMVQNLYLDSLKKIYKKARMSSYDEVNEVISRIKTLIKTTPPVFGGNKMKFKD